MQAKFPHLTTEHYWQAAVGAYYLASITCASVTEAIEYFRGYIHEGIGGWEIYRDGKRRYTYDRAHDRITPTGRILV